MPSHAAANSSSLCTEYIAQCRLRGVTPDPFLIDQLTNATVEAAGNQGCSATGCGGTHGINDNYHSASSCNSGAKGIRTSRHSGACPPTPILRLVGHALDKNTCSALSNVLGTDTFFRSIVLSDSFLGDDGAAQLFRAIRTNTNITYLDLRCNNIQRDGARALAAYLRVTSSLQVLMLEWNSIGLWDDAMKDLGESLGVNTSVVDLDLRNNKIGPHGIQLFVEGFHGNKTLRRFDLRWNNIGWIGGKALCDIFQTNNSVTELELVGNDLSEPMLATIRVALERNLRQSWRVAEAEEMQVSIQTLRAQHEAEVAALRAEIAAARRDADVRRMEANSAAAGELADCRSALQETDARLSAALAHVAELEARLEKETDGLRSAAKRDARDLREKMTGMQEELDLSNKRMQECETEIRDLEAQVSRLTREKGDLEHTLARARDLALTARDEHLMALSAAERRHKEALASVERGSALQIDKLRDMMQSKLDDIAGVLRQRESELDDLRQSFENKRRAIEAKAEESISKMEASMKHAQAELSREIQVLKSSRDQLRKDCERMTEAAQESAREIDAINVRLLAEKTAASEKANALSLQITAAKRESADARDAARVAQDRVLVVREEKETLSRTSERLEIENGELQKTIERLRRELNEVEDYERRRKREETDRLKNLESAFSAYIRTSGSASSPRKPEI